MRRRPPILTLPTSIPLEEAIPFAERATAAGYLVLIADRPAVVSQASDPVPLVCRVLGHRWDCKSVDEETKPGFVRTHITYSRCCRRCGVPNPNFQDA